MRLKFILAALAAVLFVSPVDAAGQYGDWAAIVVAADYRAHSGADSEVFDNARRDITADLVAIGFTPTNIMQFSVRPQRYPSQQPRSSDPNTISTSLWDLSNRTNGGCLAYFTSHGNTEGISMGDNILTPQQMNQMITNACGDRPTVVVVSACFSGVFIPVLKAPNRFVMTAARPDRTSFGCGEQERYTFFDNCVVQNFLGAGDFPDLANKVKACVASREQKDAIKYPSEPQLSIGPAVASQLPRWK